MAATTTTVSSAKKRTSEQAGFTTCPPPPKHRKLNTARALALSPTANNNKGKGAAIPSFAIPQTLTAQEDEEISRYDRTWMFEFNSPIIAPGSLSADFPMHEAIEVWKKASVWKLFGCKRYDDCEVEVTSTTPPSGTQWMMWSWVRLEGLWQLFQGSIHPNACAGKFAVTQGSLTRLDGQGSEWETETEKDDDEWDSETESEEEDDEWDLETDS